MSRSRVRALMKRPSEGLVSTAWVAARLGTGRLRLIEAAASEPAERLPGAARLDPPRGLRDETYGDLLCPEAFAALCQKYGLTRATSVVFYDDGDSRAACHALWMFACCGHARASVMNGGRRKWKREGRPVTAAAPAFAQTRYAPAVRNGSLRARRRDVHMHLKAARPILDVRSPAEFAGTLTAPPDQPQEGILRGGHLPGARNVPWQRALRADGTFKSREALQAIYRSEHGLHLGDEILVYSRDGRRASHTWFVLTHLLGFPRVKNYDGGWAEWGNLIGVPIAR